MSRVFANGTGDRSSIPVIPKTQKMVFDAALLNTQHYKVRIKGKVEQSKEWSCALHSYGSELLSLFKNKRLFAENNIVSSNNNYDP